MSIKINKNGKGYPIGVIPQSLYDDVEDLKSGVFPTGYSDDGLTFTDCTKHSGGYFKIGNLVILNIRIIIATASSSVKTYIELPNSIKSKNNSVALIAENVTDDNPPTYAFLSQGNKLYLKDTVANKNYVISGMWLA